MRLIWKEFKNSSVSTSTCCVFTILAAYWPYSNIQMSFVSCGRLKRSGVGCWWHVPGHHMYHSPSPDTVRTIYSIYPSILILIVWKLSSPIRIVNIVGVRIVQILQFCSSPLHLHAVAESTMDLAMGSHHIPSSHFKTPDEKIEMKSTGHMQEGLLDSQLEIFRTGVRR